LLALALMPLVTSKKRCAQDALAAVATDGWNRSSHGPGIEMADKGLIKKVQTFGGDQTPRHSSRAAQDIQATLGEIGDR